METFLRVGIETYGERQLMATFLGILKEHDSFEKMVSTKWPEQVHVESCTFEQRHGVCKATIGWLEQ